MPAAIDVPGRRTRILMLASNPAVSPTTGWPVGFWWAELTHPYWEFTEVGYEVRIASPDGGALQPDGYSDPEDASGYSAHDILSLGFKRSPSHAALLADTPAVADLDLDAFDALFLVGGQAPMVTFVDDHRVHAVVSTFFEAGKPTAIVCHATSVLLKATRPDGTLIVAGRTWTGFADSEEAYAEEFAGRRIQPFWIESAARTIPGTTFVTASRFKPFAIRDGNLVTGQQQYSGGAAARLVIQMLGV